MITRCTHCNKPIGLRKTAWASQNGTYCTYGCGVNHAATLYDASEYATSNELVRKAIAYFDDVAEQITVEDLGIEKVIYKAYSENDGTTFVFEDTFEGDTCISRELIGWYCGEPEEDIDETDMRSLKAVFVD